MFYLFIAIAVVVLLMEYLRQMAHIEKTYRFNMRMINREWHGAHCNIPNEPKFFGLGYQDEMYYLPERVLFLQKKLAEQQRAVKFSAE